MHRQLVSLVIAALGVIAAAEGAEAHAFLTRAEPRVGAKVNNPPIEVRLWFSERVQPTESSIQIFDVNGKEVDKRDTHSSGADRAILCVSVFPRLARGTYKVVWRVTSMDTHVTHGDFHFQIVP